MPEALQQQLSTITVLHASGGDDDRQQQAERVDEDVAFAALNLFVRIEATDPPFSVVFTDWLSMSPALGWRCLPVATRTSPRNRSCMSAQVPSWRQIQK
jgi:hypothetical protein